MDRLGACSALSVVLILSTAVVAAGTPHCPAGWSEGGFWCYLLNTTSTLSWAGAQALCSENNGRLVELPDRAHQLDVLDLVRVNHVSEWWIGVRKSPDTTQQEHVSVAMLMDNFGEEKGPSGSGGEYQCAFLSGRDGFWYWRSCDTAMHYICQRPAHRVPIQLVSPERIRPSSVWFNAHGRPLEIALHESLESEPTHDDKGEYSASKATMRPLPPPTSTTLAPPVVATSAGSPPEVTTVSLCQGQHWLMLDATCYQLVLDAVNWTLASQRCREQGGRLATFRTADIQRSFVSRFSHLSGSVWFGLRREADGEVSWVDGSSPGYSGWPPGQPRNPAPTAACGALTLHTGAWTNQECSAYKPFVCRRSLDATSMATTPTTVPTTTAPSECGAAGWWRYRQWCFLLVTDRPAVGWQAARDDCRSRAADLVKIEDGMENANVFHRVTQSNLPVWLGLSRRQRPHRYVWTDGSTPSFTSWEHGRNNMADLSSCVRMDNEHGSWRAVNCNSPQFYVCQRPLEATVTPAPATTPQPPSRGVCPEGWARYGPHRCLLVSDRLADWADARRTCQNEAPDGELVTIGDPIQQAYVTAAIRHSSVPLWIGLTFIRVEHQFPTWTDESAVNFTNWAPGQPSNVCDGCPVTCGLLGSARSHSPAAWSAVDCSQAFRFVCQRWAAAPEDVGLSTPAVDQQPHCAPPLDGYRKDGELCIKVVPQPATWREASAACRAENTSLAYVGDVFDNAQLMKLLHAEGADQDFWLGLSDTEQYGIQRWQAPWPSEPTFTNWEERSPQLAAPAICAALRPSTGLWRHLSCSQRRPYACVSRPLAQRALPSAAASCPSALWTASERRCYRLHEGTEHTRTWAEAKRACEEQGHQLAVISSKTDFLAVLEALSGLTSTFSAWIGGRQLPGTGKYVWVDGSEVSFDGWIEGEPSQLRQETCLEASKLSSGRWNDQKCNMYRPYICMIETPGTEEIGTYASRLAGGDRPGPGGGGWRVFGIVCLAAVAALALLGAAVWGARSYLSRPRHRRMSAASDQRRYHARENPAYADTERSLNVSVSDDDVDGSDLNGGQSWPLRGGELEEHPL